MILSSVCPSVCDAVLGLPQLFFGNLELEKWPKIRCILAYIVGAIGRCTKLFRVTSHPGRDMNISFSNFAAEKRTFQLCNFATLVQISSKRNKISSVGKYLQIRSQSCIQTLSRLTLIPLHKRRKVASEFRHVQNHIFAPSCLGC